jgi:hypothetical protein
MLQAFDRIPHHRTESLLGILQERDQAIDFFGEGLRRGGEQHELFLDVSLKT